MIWRQNSEPQQEFPVKRVHAGGEVKDPGE